MSSGNPHLYEAIGAVREHLHREGPRRAPGHPGELETEIARATERAEEGGAELTVTATRLEKDGWVLHCETREERLAHGILSEMERLRELAEADVRTAYAEQRRSLRED